VEKKQYDLCLEVLRRLEKADLLKDMILIGSWCLPFYKEYLSGTGFEPVIKTRDMDFLIPRPSGVRSKRGIQELLKDLGFVTGYRGSEGYMILEHPDLSIEFLVPERGRGSDTPVPLPTLGFNAQPLRFLDMLSHDILELKQGGLSLKVPHPANFALHKLILAGRRKIRSKIDKDRESALRVLRALVARKDERSIRRAYESIPVTWQRVVKKEIEGLNESKLLAIFE
jgi:hypothetical protein